MINSRYTQPRDHTSDAGEMLDAGASGSYSGGVIANVLGLFGYCCVRRIWAHKISVFVPRPRDTARPGSGSA